MVVATQPKHITSPASYHPYDPNDLRLHMWFCEVSPMIKRMKKRNWNGQYNKRNGDGDRFLSLVFTHEHTPLHSIVLVHSSNYIHNSAACDHKLIHPCNFLAFTHSNNVLERLTD